MSGSAAAAAPSAPGTTVLAGVDLHKSFGGVRAVQGVTIEIRRGEVHALLGDNGAGKSTILKMLAGALEPDEGSILFDGQPVHMRNPRVAKRLGIETVYQDLALAETLDIVQNVFAGREAHRLGVVRRRWMETRTWRILEELDVRIPSTVAPVRLLSGGQRQSAAIARAVGWGSHVLMLDEPTAALGVAERTHALQTIKVLRDRGLGILLISHSLPDVFEVSDRITILRRGRHVRTAPVGELAEQEVVSIITGAAL